MSLNIDAILDRALGLLSKELTKLETKQKAQNLNDQDLKALDKVVGKVLDLKKQQSDMTIEELKGLSNQELEALKGFIQNELVNRPSEKVEEAKEEPKGYKIKKSNK